MRSILPLPILLMSVVLLNGCAGGDAACRLGEPVAVLPIQRFGNVPLVPVEINGRPASLVLDTGSDATVLTRVAAARLGVAEGPGSRAVSAAGGAERVGEGRVDRLRLGGTVTENKRVLITDAPAPPIDGLLGLDTLVDYELDLDLPGARATLYRARSCPAPGPGWAAGAEPLATRMEPGSGHVFVPVQVEGDTLLGLLDTGASRTVLSLQSAGGLGVVRRRLDALPSARGQAVNSGGVMLRSRRFASVALGPVRLASPELAIADLPPTAGDALVGTDVLGQRRMWFAFTLGQVWVERR